MKPCAKCGKMIYLHHLHGSPIREGEVCRKCLDEDMRESEEFEFNVPTL